MSELLLLRAEDADDLRLISACVQDMTVKPIDTAWLPRARRLVLLGNRYRHEVAAGGRVRSALRFEGVLKAERREWPPEAHAVLPLLAVTEEAPGVLLLAFGGGTAIRLTVEAIDVTMEDVTGPWGALARPEHGA